MEDKLKEIEESLTLHEKSFGLLSIMGYYTETKAVNP